MMANILQANSLPCANTLHSVEGVKSPCPNPASKTCPNCHLVQYCSAECQKEHWTLHKIDCKHPQSKDSWKPDWHVEKRNPTFIGDDVPAVVSHGQKKFLWGNVPAVDILRIQQNEKGALPTNLNLLFAASGDMRNVVKTIVELPASFNGTCEAVMNDRDFDIVARNSILLLTILHYGPEKAVPFVIHLWYSALVPEELCEAIRKDILPLIEDVCIKIKNKPANSLQSKTWTYGTRSLRLILQRNSWDLLPSFFRIPAGFTNEEAQQVRKKTMLAPHRIDHLHRAQYSRPPAWRVSFLKFREDGMLLPFGTPRESFITPNPTFYHNTDAWPMSDSSDALDSWPIEEVRKIFLAAKNDIYGSLYFYIQSVLHAFHHRLSTLKIRFQLLQIDALQLPETLQNLGMGGPTFDRIEISNIADNAYIGPIRAPFTFSPLLKRPSQNPYATLLGLFLNAVQESTTNADETKFVEPELQKINPYMPLDPHSFMSLDISNPDVLRLAHTKGIFRDFDVLFNKYTTNFGFLEVARTAGLMIKERNTIVEKWPLRLKPGASKEEFRDLISGGHWGSERYVEWVVAR